MSIVNFLLGRNDELTNKLRSLSSDVRKEVRQLRQEGDVVGAADALAKAGAFDIAAEFYEEAGEAERAAECYEKTGKLSKASELYRSIGNTVRAGELHAALGEYSEAAERLLESGQELQAAEYFSRAGDFQRAARIFVQRQQFSRAAKCFQDAGETARQMEMLEQQFKFDFKAAQGNLKAIESSRHLAKLAGLYYLKHKKLRRGVQLLVVAGFVRETAKVLNDLGHPLEAAKLSEKHENVEDAIKYYRVGGTDAAIKRAGDLEISLAVRLGDHQKAARLYAKNGEFEASAKLLVKGGQSRAAAEMFLRAKKYEAAAELFERSGALSKAARCYEGAKEHKRAADLFAKLNDRASEMRNAAAGKDWLRVGKMFIAEERYEDLNARELLGDIHMHNKVHGAAFRFYQGALRGASPGASNLALFYKAARCLESMGRNPEASRVYEQIVTVDAGYRDIRARLQKLSPASQRSTGHPRRRTTHHPTNPPPAHSIQEEKSGKGFQRAGRAASAILKRPARRGGRMVRRNAPPGADPQTGEFSSPGQGLESFARSPSKLRRQSSGDLQAVQPASEPLRYEIFEEIARGGMGIVYKARDTVLSRVVAYKILSEALKNNEMAVEYFVREARAAAKINHNNIVTVYDAGSQGGEYYMAMEYIEGRTLKDLVARQGPFPEKLVRYLLVHACRGLQYAHEREIVHRDIKGGNMMLTTRDRQLKIMDFGLAKVLSEVRKQDQNDTRAVGTPFYMSPEQILGGEIDRRSDIYSLGVTFFEIATGTVPFFKGDVTYHHVHSPPPSPRSLNPSISVQLEQIILQAMAKRPEDRFDSCDDILRELK